MILAPIATTIEGTGRLTSGVVVAMARLLIFLLLPRSYRDMHLGRTSNTRWVLVVAPP